MDHEFDLAFNLIDEAADRIQQQQYGITRIVSHNHGDIDLTTVHDYTPQRGHHLVLLAADNHGQIAAIEATTPSLNIEPTTRILKVRANEMTFHATTTPWTYRATRHGHTYTLSAGIGDEPMWTVALDANPASTHQDLDTALTHIAAAPTAAA